MTYRKKIAAHYNAADIAVLKKAQDIKSRYAWPHVLAWLNDNDVEYRGWDDLEMLSYYLSHKDEEAE